MGHEVATEGGSFRELDEACAGQGHSSSARDTFVLRAPARSLRTAGHLTALPSGAAATIDARLRSFFATSTTGPDLVVLAFPFDPDRPVLAYQPREASFERVAALAPHVDPRPARVATIVEAPTRAGYALAVERALACIEQSALRKVVLARSLHVRADAPFDRPAVLARLSRDPSVTAFLVDLSRVTGRDGHAMIGATPELLIAREGLCIRSHPLAGSTPRRADIVLDREGAERLLRSEKDRREHAVVVESILDTLAPHCVELGAPEGVGLRSTATMWHLGTRIEGRLRTENAPSAAGLAALLHPTPAVGGDPPDLALATIRELERHDRGFYAGALGWTNRSGDGELYVTLRCAELRGEQAILHAGAGIVAGSDPASEVAETSAKFRAMLNALGIDEHASLARAS